MIEEGAEIFIDLGNLTQVGRSRPDELKAPTATIASPGLVSIIIILLSKTHRDVIGSEEKFTRLWVVSWQMDCEARGEEGASIRPKQNVDNSCECKIHGCIGVNGGIPKAGQLNVYFCLVGLHGAVFLDFEIRYSHKTEFGYPTHR